MRNELVANVSHELRTPIAALQARAGEPRRRRLAADPATLRTALAQTERLGRLVEPLLDLSRLDNGVVPLKAAPLRGVAVPVGGPEGSSLAPRSAGADVGLGRAHPQRTCTWTWTCRRRS